eukprot:3547805-Prymnesium_polylepis.1
MSRGHQYDVAVVWGDRSAVFACRRHHTVAAVTVFAVLRQSLARTRCAGSGTALEGRKLCY